MKESIFSYLVSYVPTDKRESKEDYLTQMFAWILKNVEGVAEEYISFLCEQNKDIPRPQEYNISVSTQEIMSVGRLDLLIRVNRDMSFICEHKVFSELSENQIKKYMDNSDELGPGKYYSVLLTYSMTQHTQTADVSLVWSDICEFIDGLKGNYEHEENFVLSQFSEYLKENGMGKNEPIGPESLLGYWPAVNLENKLDNIFSQLAVYDWSMDCPNLEGFSTGKYNPVYNRSRWGRMGIDFFENWTPGIFAGIMLRTNDHHMPPLDEKKGPDLVVFMESSYSKAGKDSEIYNSIITSDAYKRRVKRLTVDSGSFEFIPGLADSKWRVVVLRKPLFDVLFGKYTREEQLNAIKEAFIEGINLLVSEG